MKKKRGVIVLVLTAIITVFLCYTAAVGLGPTGTGAAKNIKTGLDLSGGVSITCEAKDKNPSKEDMSDTVYKMQKRVEQYSTEAQAYQEGDNRITVEIPGVTDADKILNDIGKPGSLMFDGTEYHLQRADRPTNSPIRFCFPQTAKTPMVSPTPNGLCPIPTSGSTFLIR